MGQSLIKIEPIIIIVMGIDRDNPKISRIIAKKQRKKPLIERLIFI
jgi:hypothetical protein